jgi:NitT/TauT family transport system ATP-binding protein
MDGSLLEVRGLGKRFAARDGRSAAPWVLKDLTFTVQEGEFLTLVGPSGSGKSTLLNIISQVDGPSAGEIVFRGERISGAATLRPGWGRQIGYVTQDDNLLPWRTTIDNVLFPLEVKPPVDGAARARAHELMAAVGLAGFEKYYPHELSGGMRKRAALIRTLVYDPPVILMDEPFGALDAQTRLQLQSDLLKLWRMGRKTIVFVTHDITEAIALGDRTIVLTQAPTRIAGAYDIPIPRPRDISRIIAAPGFQDVHDQIRAQIQ